MSTTRSLWVSAWERASSLSGSRSRSSVVLGAAAAIALGAMVLSSTEADPGMGNDVAAAGSQLHAGGAAVKPAPGAVPEGRSADRQQRVLTEFLAKRFRVAHDAVGTFVAAAFRAGTEHRVDPLLVLAVVAVESRFNPVAESALGAKGLMQVLPQYHQDKLAAHGGDSALLDPIVNIDVGTRILREYLRRGGDLKAGLKLYSGGDDEFLVQYAGKVLSERAKMEALLLGQRKVGI